ncbi:MAG TPA: hypothetical protein VFG15_03985 [Amycolatopsis sp.]|nr:hypothetical protein [Amycolatopsis sp.]
MAPEKNRRERPAKPALTRDGIAAAAVAILREEGLRLVARPSGENYLALVENLLVLLAEGDVPPERRAWGIDILLQHATATAAEHAARDSPDDWDALARAVRDADETTHPQVAAHAADLLAGQPEQRMSWGWRVLITGITHTGLPP